MIVLLFICIMYMGFYPTLQEKVSEQEETVVDEYSDDLDGEETESDSSNTDISLSGDNEAVAQAIQAIEEKEKEAAEEVSADENATQEVHYEFRTKSKFEDHFKKHGEEMGFSTPEEYLEAANALINNPDALQKLEAEDNDKIYYLESTNEIAFVSQDGYLRTYFICSGKAYYDRQ